MTPEGKYTKTIRSYMEYSIKNGEPSYKDLIRAAIYALLEIAFAIRELAGDK